MSSSLQLPPVLTGRAMHRMRLFSSWRGGEAANPPPSSRKRKHPDAINQIKQQGNVRDDGDGDDDDDDDGVFAGWIFQPCDSRTSRSPTAPNLQQETQHHHHQEEEEEYILSVPARWTRDIARAVAHNLTVKILRYRIIIHIPEQRPGASTSSNVITRRKRLLEVSDHLDALSIASSGEEEVVNHHHHHHHDNNNNTEQHHQEDLWTLRQLARLEAADQGIRHVMMMMTQQQQQQQQQQQVGDKSSRGKKDKQPPQVFSLSNLIVEAVSPVICMNERDDPFALLHVYDQESCRYSCVVVLKGRKRTRQSAAAAGPTSNTTCCPLSILPALRPGDCIETISNARRQSWGIPKLLMQQSKGSSGSGSSLDHQHSIIVPHRVFVVDRAQQIQFGTAMKAPPRQDESSSIPLLPYPLPPPFVPQPSLPDPARTVRGKIIHVRWIYLDHKRSNATNATKKQQQQLHYILIEPLVVADKRQQAAPVVRNPYNGSNDKKSSGNDDDDGNSSYSYDLLYLTYFPMDTCLQYSLRVGALVEATNFHLFLEHHHPSYQQLPSPSRPCSASRRQSNHQRQLPRRVWTACLRSTVTLLRPSSSSTLINKDGDLEQKGNLRSNTSTVAAMSDRSSDPSSSRQGDSLLQTGPPYAFVQAKSTHSFLELFCRYQVKIWLDQNEFFHSFFMDDTSKQQSSSMKKSMWDSLTVALLSSITRNSSSHSQSEKKSGKNDRNPYAEFFHCGRTGRQEPNDVDDEQEHFSILRGECLFCPLMQSSLPMASGSSVTDAPIVLPSLATLDQLRDACMESTTNRLSNELAQRQQQHRQGGSQSLFSAGWTASFVLAASDFSIQPESRVNISCSPPTEEPILRRAALWTGGLVRDLNDKNATPKSRTSGHWIFHLDNGRISLPVQLLASSTSKVDDSMHAKTFFWIDVQSAVVSCIFLGKLPSEDDRSTSRGFGDVRINHLPFYPDTRDRHQQAGKDKNADDEALGPCSLIQVRGCLFMVSVYLCATRGGSFLDLTTEEEKVAPERKDTAKTRKLPASNDSSNIAISSIRACLDPAVQEDESSTRFIVGFMVRKFFKLTKPRSGLYHGCMLTLSHIPVHDGPDELHSPCCLQSIDVKTSVKVNESVRLVMRRAFAKVLTGSACGVASEDQITLAMVWWKLGCSVHSVSLLSGGWDELSSSASSGTAQKVASVVQIPRSAARLDPRRGYVRFRCALRDISSRAIFVDSKQQYTGREFPNTALVLQQSPSCSFDFTASDRFFPGMLEGRSRRLGNIPWGLLTVAPNEKQNGIPVCTLADMHWSICTDLRNVTRVNLAPSLVRQVCGATFLGVSYCRAMAECTKCFKALQEPLSANRGDTETLMPPRNGVASAQQQSFWNLPLPMHMNKKSLGAVAAPAAAVRSCNHPSGHIKSKTHLICPNACNTDLYAAIKWECSGTLDDGTGQAVLYAERNVALTLLGMDPKTAQQIEQGAWLQPDGIIYKKVLPPKTSLRQAIERAQGLARNEKIAAVFHRQYHQPQARYCRLEETDVLKLLPPTCRAEYLLQRHCRGGGGRSSVSAQGQERGSWSLEKSYYVRCKPLADEASSLNHTEITAVAPGHNQSAAIRKVSTYSLPPLKLNLVDMAIATGSSH